MHPTNLPSRSRRRARAGGVGLVALVVLTACSSASDIATHTSLTIGRTL
jgi:hypothetical protein